MPDYARLLATCEAAAWAGARELLDWQGRFSTQKKAARDLVTDADLASQQAIRAVIEAEFPDHGFLGEEAPDMQQLSRSYCWVADPLDGTTNYVHSFPLFCVSVAVAHEGEVVAGAIIDPLRSECFLAAKAMGGSLNGKPIAVSTAKTLPEALVAVSFPPETKVGSPDIQAFLDLAPQCQAVRRTGSAALNLAYVACGRLDAHWAHFIYPWDSAAGVLLVREAGGVASAYLGKNYHLADGNYLVAATDELHQAILPRLAATVPSAD